MPRYLVVANQTLGGAELMDEIRRRIASGPSSFYVVVPASRVGVTLSPFAALEGGPSQSVPARIQQQQEGLSDRAERAVQTRLNQLTSQIRAEGAEAQGGAGPTDPIKAIDEVIAQGFDEIIISTLPEGVSRWLRMDVPNRVKRKFKIQVTTVTAKK